VLPPTRWPCRKTGKPYYNVIVWNDGRTREICEELKRGHGIDRFRGKTGLPLATYFSATKILWVLRNVPGVREDAAKGDAIFGTVDSWLLWQLTGQSSSRRPGWWQGTRRGAPVCR
jgi:glycerol kinase